MKHRMRWTLLLLMLLPCAVLAGEPQSFDYSSFGRIPVLHEGRIKPLSGFARVLFARTPCPSFSSADAWLAAMLFAPETMVQQPCFAVQSAETAHLLSLPENPSGRYSFAELAPGLAHIEPAIAQLMQKERKNLSPGEQDLIRLYDNVNAFADLLSTFSLLLPFPGLDRQARQTLHLPADTEITYLDLLKSREKLATAGHDDLAAASLRMQFLETMGSHNLLLRVIPPAWKSQEWLSPWAVLATAQGSPQSAALFADWRELALSYRHHDARAWQQASQRLQVAGSQATGVRPWALTLEMLYHRLNLLTLSLCGYLLALTLIAIGLWRHPGKPVALAYGVMAASVTLHGIALAMRMAILMRPPVSTLYESMIFVSFIAAGFGLLTERRHKGAEGLLIGSIIAALLLTAARIFAAGSDTLEVLVAVLNTNFWLATHVVCITTGYGASLLAGTLAHIYLFRRAMGHIPVSELAALHRRMHHTALTALFFTAIGTMLGGIWADQSWGRFWGWDPKENGALWIVLWLIWLLHGRIAGQLRELGFAVALALINIVVALAWVGVNLLSVGLHSYGFTDTAATGLTVFCAAELGTVTLLLLLILRLKRLFSASVA
jgi:ABC-type transport system involved in cytochrome c biogenesis permease subunit